MILDALYERSKTLDLPPPRYKTTQVHWAIPLDLEGNAYPPISRMDDDGRGLETMIPSPGARTSAVTPSLLADTGEYTLGIKTAAKQETEKQRQRCFNKFEAFRDLARQCADETGIPEVEAVVSFLDSGPFENSTRFDQIDGSQIAAFEVNGVFVHDHPGVQAWWANAGADTAEGACLVTGERGALVRRHPVPLKRLPGSQSQYQLISANEDAFYSYGLEESYIAPMSLAVSESIHHTLNELLRNEESRVKIGDVVFLFWTRENQAVPVGPVLNKPTPDSVKLVFESTWKAKPTASVQEDAFYCLTLGSSGSRAVIRDWIEEPVSSAQQNLRRYFSRQRITGNKGYFSLYALAGATVRDLNDLSPLTPIHLVRHALFGSPLPHSILVNTLHRCDVGYKAGDSRRQVSQAQAALIKLYLLDNSELSQEGDDFMVGLDPEFNHPAYLIGRLVRVLERVQYHAVRATSVGQSFGTTANTPGLTIPRHVKRAQAHLKKLYRDNPGFATNRDKEITDLMSRVEAQDGFPSRLTTKEQGWFVLGYYHQRAHDFEKE